MPNPRNFSVIMQGAGSRLLGGTLTNFSSSSMYATRDATDGRRPKPRGKYIPPTSYSLLEYSGHTPHGSIYEYQENLPSNNVKYSGYFDPAMVQPNMWATLQGAAVSQNGMYYVPAGLTDAALGKARLKLKGGMVNLAVAWAERTRVSSQILNTARTLADSFRLLKRGRWRKACRKLRMTKKRTLAVGAARGVSNQWLAMQYGWLPLLSDIHGSVVTLSKLDRADWRVSVVSGHKRESVVKPTIVGLVNDSWYREVSSICQHRVYCRIDAIPAVSALTAMSNVGVTNPLEVAWELVPYSFVVDWFLPIGKYLSQFDALAGWEILGCSQSVFSKCKIEYRGRNHEWFQGGNKMIAISDWRADYRDVRLVRTGGTVVPFPVFPKIKDPRSRLHMANALTLLVQAFAPKGVNTKVF